MAFLESGEILNWDKWAIVLLPVLVKDGPDSAVLVKGGQHKAVECFLEQSNLDMNWHAHKKECHGLVMERVHGFSSFFPDFVD